MKTIPDIAERFFDENIRVDKIIWLEANASSQCDDLEDYLEEEYAEEIAKLFGTTVSQVENFAADPEEFTTWLARSRKTGFLVKAATPVPHDIRKDSCSFSWGYTQHEWFLTDALDEAFLLKLIDWKASIKKREAAKERRKAKQEAKP